MTVGLLVDCDELVAKHFLEPRGQTYFKYDKALGLIKDGVLVGTTTTGGSPTNANPLQLAGSTVCGSGGTIVGTFDDVRIYNRALSAAEIAAIYAGGK